MRHSTRQISSSSNSSSVVPRTACTIYAAFYAARPLLATRNLDSSRHSGVIGLFQEHFGRTGLVPNETARPLARAFEKRQTSDYSDFSEPSSDEVLSLRDQVQAFVSRV